MFVTQKTSSRGRAGSESGARPFGWAGCPVTVPGPAMTGRGRPPPSHQPARRLSTEGWGGGAGGGVCVEGGLPAPAAGGRRSRRLCRIQPGPGLVWAAPRGASRGRPARRSRPAQCSGQPGRARVNVTRTHGGSLVRVRPAGRRRERRARRGEGRPVTTAAPSSRLDRLRWPGAAGLQVASEALRGSLECHLSQVQVSAAA